MKTLQTYTDLESSDKGAVIALGNFDGLHRGHQVVIAKAKAIADEINAPLGIGPVSYTHLTLPTIYSV